jgi:hypothetical protein
MDADVGAGAHSSERRAFREYLRIRPDAHLEVLRPDSLSDQHSLETHRVRRSRADVVKALSDHREDRSPQAFRLRRVASCLFFDHSFEQTGDKGHAARLDCLQVTGSEEPGRA